MTSQSDIEPAQKVAYEWVLSLSKGEEVVLSEYQFSLYKNQVESEDMRQMFFKDFMVNPVFVTEAHRQKAVTLKYRYPCMKCHGSGRKVGNTGWCEACGGSGVDLPTK